MKIKNKKPFLVIPFVIISLLMGIYAGLVRMGWDLPINASLAHHGLLMVGTFLGTVILLERVSILKRTWLYLFPLINVLSLPFFLAAMGRIAMVMLIIGGIGLLMCYVIIYLRHKEIHVLVMAFGAALIISGYYLIWAGQPYPFTMPYLFGFILFTIVGERMDLGKFLPDKPLKRPLLWLSFLIIITGMLVDYHQYGNIITGGGMMLLSAWLLKYDIVTKSIKSQGLHKYIGILLFTGYFWLMVTGILMIINESALYFYDALIHSFFLGFTFSMIFAHAPIIFPGVVGLSFKPYHQSLYFWMILLNISLVTRIIMDLMAMDEWRLISGLVNGIVIVGFFINLVILVRKSITAG